MSAQKASFPLDEPSSNQLIKSGVLLVFSDMHSAGGVID